MTSYTHKPSKCSWHKYIQEDQYPQRKWFNYYFFLGLNGFRNYFFAITFPERSKLIVGINQSAILGIRSSLTGLLVK